MITQLSTLDSRLPAPRGWPLPAAMALVIVVFWPTVIELLRYWNNDDNYSHGFMVPVVSLIFAVTASRQAGTLVRTRLPQRSVRVGMLSLVLGMIVHAVAVFVNFPLLDVAGLVLTLRGMLYLLGGRKVWRANAFSVWFLLFMAPLPLTWYQVLSRTLQNVATHISASGLTLVGVPVLVEGQLLHVPGYTLEVAEACSGMRQVMAFLALSVIVARMSGGRGWSRWVPVLLAMPIAVAANCLRIVITGVLIRIGGVGWVTGTWHTAEGLVTLMLGLLLFAAAARALRCRSGT
ncbi:MAG: exosortase/archaeosortase family protein [Planctomycetales bacterium]|nr:exosortase/archaeosortase family protein [Planctomycetales bacterium]